MSSSINPGTIPMAVYYVLPVESSDDNTQVSDDHRQVCNYYYRNAGDDTYVPAPAQLEAVASGLGLDYIVLRQLSPDAISPRPSNPTIGATLFSATTKNLVSSNVDKPLPNIFLAATATTANGDMPSVVIPVASTGELRGVILVFSVQNSKVNLLRGTRDPEIKGSTNG